MRANKMFQVLVLGGATLTGALMGCPESPLGIADAGDTDGGGDGGVCVCVPDSSWPGQDCAPQGKALVCCWLTPNATCCPH